MAERAAELDSSEFDVVFSAAHMLRLENSHTTGNMSRGFALYRCHLITVFEV